MSAEAMMVATLASAVVTIFLEMFTDTRIPYKESTDDE